MRFWPTALIGCALCCAPPFASAATVLALGHYTVDPSQGTLLIELRGSSNLSDLVGMTLRMQIGEIDDLAPPVFMGDFNLAGSIWPNSAIVVGTSFDMPNLAHSNIAAEDLPLEPFADCLLATIAVDVSSAEPGTYPLHWWNFDESNFTELFRQNDPNPVIPPELELQSGSITVVPEPATLLLTLLGGAVLAAGYRYVR